jgi:hypothetical protein
MRRQKKIQKRGSLIPAIGKLLPRKAETCLILLILKKRIKEGIEKDQLISLRGP